MLLNLEHYVFQNLKKKFNNTLYPFKLWFEGVFFMKVRSVYMAKLVDIKKSISSMTLSTKENLDNEKPKTTISENKQNYTPQNNVTPSDLHRFIKTLKDGVDYGTLPNVNHAVLFKTGALKILKFLGLKHTPQLIEKTIDVPNGFLGYTVMVTITDHKDTVIHKHLGSANTLESKFSKKGFSADNTILAVATKRAIVGSVKDIISNSDLKKDVVSR